MNARPLSRIVILVLSVLLSLSERVPVQAGLIVSDRFDSASYPLGETISGKSGGTGFSSAYDGSPEYMTAGPGLSFGTMPTSGNAARLNFTPIVLATLWRVTTTVPAQGADLWMSLLMQQQPGDRLSVSVLLKPRQGSDPQGSIGYHLENEDPHGQFDLRTTAYDGHQSASDHLLLARDSLETSLFVTRLSNVGGGSLEHPQEMTTWVLSASDYSNLTFPLVTEATLDLHNSGKVSTQAPFAVIPSAVDSLEFAVAMFNTDMIIDELRMGTSLADVLVSPVPEPREVLGVAGLLLLGWAGLRRCSKVQDKTRLKETHWVQRLT